MPHMAYYSEFELYLQDEHFETIASLKCHKDHCIEISAQSEYLYKFDLWPLCDPLMTLNKFQNIFKMLTMS